MFEIHFNTVWFRSMGLYILWFQNYGTGIRHLFSLFSWKSDIDENGSLTNTQRLKIIKNYYKNGDGRPKQFFQTKFSSVIKHIPQSVGMLINKIVVFGVLRIYK